MFRFSGKKFVVASVACLLLVACLGTQVATADFDVQLAPRYVSWDWASDYLDCSMGYGEDGSPDGLWIGDLSDSAQSPDGYLNMEMSAYQSSVVGLTAFSVSNVTSAAVQGLDPLIGTQVGTAADGQSGFYIKFMVTEDTPVQFVSDYHNLSATAGGTASLAVELKDWAASTMLYSYYDSVTDGCSSGSFMSSLITLHTGTLYSIRVVTDALSEIDVVTDNKPVEAYAAGAYSLAIVPEPTSLLMLALGGLLAAGRRR